VPRVRGCGGASVGAGMRRCIARPLACSLVVAVSAGSAAQSPSDFSGHWKINQAKSSAGATGNNAKVSFPSELVVAHHGSDLRVEIRYPRTDPIVATYPLGGGDVAVPVPGVTETARAVWDGGRLVITARRVVSTPFGDFVTDTREVWSRAGGVLTIQKTQTSEGLSETETGVFEGGS